MTPKEIEQMLALENERARIGQNAATIASAEELNGRQTRSVDLDPLAVGDEFTLTEDNLNKVLCRPLGRGKVYFMNIAVKNGEVQSVKQFYPTSMTKVRRAVIENDGTVMQGDRKKASGSAAAAYASQTNMLSSLKQLVGKTIKVSARDQFRSRQFGTNEIIDDSVLTFDFVG